MVPHEFIFQPGLWIGEGKVTFSASPEHLRFFTKWRVEKSENGLIRCQQQVEMEGREGDVFNTLVFSDITANSCIVELTSDLLGTILGKCVMDKRTVAWEFRGHPEFEGFEVYELQDNRDYMLHAEYAASDQLRTVIDGRVWRKGS